MHHHDNRTDALFASIDQALAGHELQRSTEHAPGGATGCVRCSADPEPGSGFCAPCRAFMLGDLDVDPASIHAAADDGQALDDLRSAGWAVLNGSGQAVASPKALQLVSAALRPVSS